MGRPPKGSKPEQAEPTQAEILYKELFYDQKTLGLVKTPNGMYAIHEFDYNSSGDVRMGNKATPEEDMLNVMKERMFILMVQRGII